MRQHQASTTTGADRGFPVTLVLGANGRIGRLLRRCWSSSWSDEWPADAQVRWQARRRPPHSSPYSSGDSRAEEDWRICAPLEDPDALAEAAKGAEVILCLAGVTPGQKGGDMADNIRLAEAALRAAADSGAGSGARVLLASSAAVYGAHGGYLGGDLDETAPLRPAQPYGAAKAEMESRCARLGKDLGVEVCALRIGNIAGLDAILGGWAPGFRLDRFADGTTPRRSYIGLQCLARVLAALVRTANLPGVLNVAQPGPVEMGDLLRAAGRDFTLRPAPDTAIPEVALDVTRLAAILPQDVPLPRADPAQLVAEWAALVTESDA